MQAGPAGGRGATTTAAAAAPEGAGAIHADFFRMGSPPPSVIAARAVSASVGGTSGSQVLCVAVVSDARVIATVTRSGKLSLNHTDSGIAVRAFFTAMGSS